MHSISQLSINGQTSVPMIDIMPLTADMLSNISSDERDRLMDRDYILKFKRLNLFCWKDYRNVITIR